MAIGGNAFIDGIARPALSGETFPTTNPATGRELARVAACGAGGRRPRRSQGARGLRGRPLAQPGPGRAQAGADRLRQADRAQPARAGRAREPGQRQARRRVPDDRRPRDGQHHPLARRADRQDLRQHGPGRPRRHGAGGARADRRRRLRAAVELPAADDGVEDRPGAGRGLLRHRQAGRGDLAHRAPPRRARLRGRRSGRRPQRRDGHRPGGRRAHRPPSRHRHGQLHRVDRDGQALPALRRRLRT